MTRILRLFFCFALLAPVSKAATPDVQEILRKLVERSEAADAVQRRNQIAYQRTSRVEYLNDDGTKKRDVIRIYKIAPENGKPMTRLISVNGRPAADKDDKKRSAARETGEKSRMLTLTEDILSRFEFTFVREEQFASRTAYVLSFVPKADTKDDSFLDHLINAMAGTFWIDKEDYQLAKADIHLSKRVAFFGGMAGAIDKLNLTLLQRRVENSVWLSEALHIDFAGRKLFSNIKFRCFENCGEFQALREQHASAK
jgi:hypothetical protein